MFQPGCWNYFFTAIVGAVLGALIALALLWLLNSSLRLNESVEVNVLEQQSLQAAASMQAELTGVGSDLELLNGQFSALLTRESETARQLDTMQEYLDETGGELTETVKDITALQKDAAEMDERITTVSGSAEDFDAFLNGLRDLLLSMPGLESSPSITGTEPATLISTTVTPTVAATGTPALTPSATRTPLSTRTRRPTATPFGETRPTDR